MARVANFFAGVRKGPVSGYYKFYAAGTASLVDSALKDTYPTYEDALALDNANANPVLLNASGYPSTGNGIWLVDSYLAVAYDEDDLEIWREDYVNADPYDGVAVSPESLLRNGSFEAWSAGLPDNQTITKYDDAVDVEQDTDDSYHGGSALKVTGTADGGIQDDWDDYFEVSPGEELLVEFFLKCGAANCRNIVQLRWFQDDAGTVSATPTADIYDEAAANPTSWTRKYDFATPPSDARYAKLRTILIDPSSTTLVTTVQIDGVSVRPAVKDANDLTVNSLSISGENKGIGFTPSDGTAIPGARLVAVVKGTTGGDASTTFKYGIVSSSSSVGGTGYQELLLARALAAKHLIIATINESTHSSIAANHNLLYGTYGSIDVITYNESSGAIANMKYSLMVWEFD